MRWQLTWLILVLAAVPLGLAAVGATPYVPSGVPDANGVATTLRGSDLPVSTIGYVLVDAAWIVWAWLVLSLLLRIALNLVDAAAHGAAWIDPLRRFSDALTLPLVRRAVDGALAAVLIANVALRAVPVAGAEPLVAAPAAVVTTVESPTASVIPDSQRQPTQAIHVVKPGESLWSIAEEYYGSGREYPRLIEANVGQTMANGQVFARTGVIEPGWSLRVPLASSNIENVNGEYFYTVESGDTLWGISGRLLGDETRWPELFDANRDVAQLEDGRVLRDPNLIWPTLRLRLPPPLAIELLEQPAPADEVPAQSVPAEPSQSASNGTTTDVERPTTDGSVLVSGAAAAAVAGAAAIGAVVIGRRRGRHDLFELPLSTDPQGDIPIRGGFAETDPARDLAQDLPPHAAMVLAGHVERAVADHGARVVMVRYGHSHSSVMLAVPAEAAPTVKSIAPALASRLGTAVQVRTSPEGDLVFDIVTATAPLPSNELAGPELLLACVLTDRSELWVNPAEAGHLLVASLPGGGADQVTASLLAASAARRAPGDLKVWTIAAPNELPAVLEGLPQQLKPRASAHNTLEIEATLRDVRAELIRRMQGPPQAEPDVLLVVGELACLDYASQRTTLDMLATYGPSHGVRLIAATRDASNIPDEVLKFFSSRLVLRTATPEQSQRLLGQSDAADLLGGGQLWARIGGRRPLEGYGIRTRPDLLERFIRLLRARHGLPPLSTPRDDARDAVPRPKLVQLEDVDAPTTEGATPVQVRCFGGFEVRGPGGELVPTIDELTTQRGWDVLARLAAAPEGAVALPQLLDDLWPGVERATAETQLRSAVASLRHMLDRVAPALQAEVVRFAPGDLCHLDTQLVISDVHRFLRLCRAAPQMPPDQARLAWQRARGLYRGALLDGPGARAWPWASVPDVESAGPSLRDRYREHAYHATRGLARLATADGHLDEAIGFYEELLSVEPTLEDVVRELCECYLQLGDRAAVREQEHRLNRALQAAYLAAGPNEDPMAYEPEPATVALFERAHREMPAAAAVAD